MPTSLIGCEITTFKDLNLIVEHGTPEQVEAAKEEIALALDDFS
jgi:hypothetical protein